MGGHTFAANSQKKSMKLNLKIFGWIHFVSLSGTSRKFVDLISQEGGNPHQFPSNQEKLFRCGWGGGREFSYGDRCATAGDLLLCDPDVNVVIATMTPPTTMTLIVVVVVPVVITTAISVLRGGRGG